MDENVNAIVKSVDCVDLATWSDDRRKEFSATFAARIVASRYILAAAARIVLERAHARHFMGDRAFREAHSRGCGVDHDPGRYGVYGGRSVQELNQIAQERAEHVLRELPPLQKAMLVLKPEVAKMIDERDAIKAKCEKLGDELEKLGEKKSLADFDQKMTVGELRKQLKEIASRRREIISLLDELSKEGFELDARIDRETAAGVPGIAKAVIDTAQQMTDKAAALDQISRRVHEKVMFGDSKEAVELLRSFEKDEAEVGAAVHKQLRDAVAALGIVCRTKKVACRTKGGRK